MLTNANRGGGAAKVLYLASLVRSVSDVRKVSKGRKISKISGEKRQKCLFGKKKVKNKARAPFLYQ